MITAAVHKALSAIGPAATHDEVSAAAEQAAGAISIDDDAITDVLAQMWGDAYAAGAHAATEMIVSRGGPVALSAGTTAEGAEFSQVVDWSTWAPGNPIAAQLASGPGLQAMLDQAGQTIIGLDATSLDALGDALARGLNEGANVDTIAGYMSDVLTDPDRALAIANTETCRAMTNGVVDTYTANGIGSVEWLAEDDACFACEANADGSPYDLADAPQPPEHPNCRCALAPVVDQG
jgi:SPP1 gp7 family putative phage head morphogenesis protein